MAETQPAPQPGTDIAWMQETALLDTTLTRIIRYAQLMQAGLREDQINISHAGQLGHAVLTVLKQASAIGERAEIAARAAVA